MRSSVLLALAASLSVTSAVYQGFNYGATQTDGSVKSQTDFENEFKTAQNLIGTSGFTSARIYTTIQAGTTNSPTLAIPAAINTKTTLLLGLWASGGQAVFDNEIAALKAAISQYGTAFANLVTGISIGSEDLYRISPTGLAAPDAAPGADPATLVNYINQARSALSGTALSGAMIGHVDTWTAWVNGSNADVIKNSDFIGMDAYPYFQSTMSNGIENNYQLFFDAYDATVAASQGKDVWVTETGFPVSGKTSNLAVPSLANAKTYWDEVGCNRLFGKINTYWFTLQDAFPFTPNPSFGIVGSTLSTTPLFDLSCPAVPPPSSATPSASASPEPSASVSGSNSGSSSAATGPIASGGLTPAQGGGHGIASSVISATTTAPVASNVATISASGTTIVTSVVSGNATVSIASPTKSSGTAPSQNPTNGAVAGSGSIVGVIGAMMVAVAAL